MGGGYIQRERERERDRERTAQKGKRPKITFNNPSLLHRS